MVLVLSLFLRWVVLVVLLGLFLRRLEAALVLVPCLFLRWIVLVILLGLLLRRVEAAFVLFLCIFLRCAVLGVLLNRRQADLIVYQLDLSDVCKAVRSTEKKDMTCLKLNVRIILSKC